MSDDQLPESYLVTKGETVVGHVTVDPTHTKVLRLLNVFGTNACVGVEHPERSIATMDIDWDLVDALEANGHTAWGLIPTP